MNLSGISRIATQPILPTAAQASGPAAKPGGPVGDFTRAVHDALGAVDHAQQASAISIQDLLAGKSQDILPVVAEVAKADLSFKLLMGVRNKVIEAYKHTMNMQI
ncbi:MAG: flagellar hook-basal body complex protein FliE [Planctomycetes bacterium]|nr:flagellar hook-basal body complex protein FliE [Planctomycetota bacterium]